MTSERTRDNHVRVVGVLADWREDHRKVRYMEWLTTAPSLRNPPSKAKLAKELGVDERTLRGWQRQPLFRQDWEANAQEVIRSPERTSEVLDELYRVATDPTAKNQVQAARLYLEATDAIKPKPIEVKVTKPAELSDAELDALLAEGAAALREQRDART